MERLGGGRLLGPPLPPWTAFHGAAAPGGGGPYLTVPRPYLTVPPVPRLSTALVTECRLLPSDTGPAAIAASALAGAVSIGVQLPSGAEPHPVPHLLMNVASGPPSSPLHPPPPAHVQGGLGRGFPTPRPSRWRVSARTRLPSLLDALTLHSQPGAQLRLMRMRVHVRSKAVPRSLWGSLRVRGSARDPGHSCHCVHYASELVAGTKRRGTEHRVRAPRSSHRTRSLT